MKKTKELHDQFERKPSDAFFIGDWLPISPTTDVGNFRTQAFDALARFQDRFKNLHDRLTPESRDEMKLLPYPVREKAHQHIRYMRSAGLQAWVVNLFAIYRDCRSPAELSQWCTLQYAVIDEYHIAFYGNRELWPLISVGEYDNLALVSMQDTIAFLDALFDPVIENRTRAIELLDAMPDIRGYQGRWVHHLPSQVECEKLVHRAWQFMRQMGHDWPVEPREVKDSHAARSCLDQVVAWCRDVDTERSSTKTKSVGEKSPKKQQAMPGYLRLIVDEDRKVITREGFELKGLGQPDITRKEINLSRAPAQWHIFYACFLRGGDEVPFDEMWNDYPSERKHRHRMQNELNKKLARLGVHIADRRLVEVAPP